MLSGGLEVGVVGESHYQDALTAIVGGKRPESVRIPTQATLVPEPDNPYDPNAVVWRGSKRPLSQGDVELESDSNRRPSDYEDTGHS
jgi:protoporphyrinogen oxidase